MYPSYAKSERIADGLMHLLGVCGAIVGASLLLVFTIGEVGTGQSIALGVYCAALISTFCASAFYHMTPWEGLRPTLRRIDHAAIYLKIAGTYTPLVVMIGSGLAYTVLALVWGLAVIGMVMKIFFWRVPGPMGVLLPLVMGWMSLALIWGLVPIVPLPALLLIATGGVLYTLGVVFFLWDSLKFSNAVWHGFVVAASACFFTAILLGALATA